MKRFTATEKWDKEWFMDLSLKHKVLWQFLCDNCDCAGVWEPNWKLATLMIGEPVSSTDLAVFGDRAVILDGNGKVLMTGFVGFQYGPLSANCKPHQSIIRTIQKHGIGHLIPNHERVGEGENKGYSKGIHTLEEKDKDKVKEKEEEKDSVQNAREENGQHPKLKAAERIADLYPRPSGSTYAAVQAILAAVDEGGDIAWICACVEKHRECYFKLPGAERKGCPGRQTYFAERRWKDNPDELPWTFHAKTNGAAKAQSASDPHYIEPKVLTFP